MFVSDVYANTWKINEIVDEFEGTTTEYAISNAVKPNAPLDFPYEDLKVKFLKFCESENAGLYFSEDPNLLNGDIKDGFTSFLVDVKLDGRFSEILITQKWGGKQLNIHNNSIFKVLNSKSFFIQLEHYSGGTRYYKFNLSEIPC